MASNAPNFTDVQKPQGNGRYTTMIQGVADGVEESARKNRRMILILGGLVLVGFACIFGLMIAAIDLMKDLKVDNDDPVIRSSDGDVVGTGIAGASVDIARHEENVKDLNPTQYYELAMKKKGGGVLTMNLKVEAIIKETCGEGDENVCAEGQDFLITYKTPFVTIMTDGHTVELLEPTSFFIDHVLDKADFSEGTVPKDVATPAKRKLLLAPIFIAAYVVAGEMAMGTASGIAGWAMIGGAVAWQVKGADIMKGPTGGLSDLMYSMQRSLTSKRNGKK